MHNRARLVVGSFLTKDLGIDWRWGERWFMRLLLDGDEASNNGNWQWIASVGVDPQPAFAADLQPGPPTGPLRPGRPYVRRYVPELRDGTRADYPEPIVDHARPRAAKRSRAIAYSDATGRGRQRVIAAPGPSSTSWALGESGGWSP